MRRATGSLVHMRASRPGWREAKINWSSQAVPVEPQLGAFRAHWPPWGCLATIPPRPPSRPRRHLSSSEMSNTLYITPVRSPLPFPPAIRPPVASHPPTPLDKPIPSVCSFPPPSITFVDPQRPILHPNHSPSPPVTLAFPISPPEHAPFNTTDHRPKLPVMKFSIISTVAVLSFALASFAAPIAAPPSSDGFFGPSWGGGGKRGPPTSDGFFGSSWGGSGKRDLAERAPPKPDCGFFGPCWYGGGKREAAPPKPDCGFFGPCWYGGGKA
ncbi:hypothetical protein CALCODRAFT_366257 [Calocera cornea HHB12733]|uniref:Uncharacterized protein n=1 Tax=Calocera cornea HHB12733 TaxID=1353952 RepID=A0A165J9X9_9BASI|nr:hypothetical protein CALCODRAFT_366257 [Calocera cornea HHB12733]